MVTRRTYWLCLGIAAAVIFVAWADLVPAWITGSTSAFGWMIAVVVALAAVSVMTVRAGRSTRSVAHVLYDAEQQQKGTDR